METLKMNPTSIRLGLAAMVAASMAVPAMAQDFRINPYLQNPSDDGMLFTWFTEADVPATLSISGGDLVSPVVLNVSGTNQPNLAYTPAESTDAMNKGYPLFSDNNYKYSAPVSGLTPNTTYNYTVQLQGGASFSRTFRTAPTATNWSHIRFMALSDSETEPRGNTNQRDWSPGVQAPGSAGRPANLPEDSSNRDLYPLTETVGYQQNLRIIDQRDPDFIVQPGDLVQGGGYQLGWDEYFRHNAGDYDDVLTKRPLLPALGNWENFGAINGGYSPAAVQNARQKYKTYFDTPSNGTPEHQDQYYRTDYGPVTVLTLDSSNGLPDDHRNNYNQPVADPYQIGTDTQQNVDTGTYPGNDLADFNPGSAQYQWVVAQLQDARAKGQMVFVQFHHVPYSSGTHGFGMAHPNSSGQGGTPLRIYHPLFEQYGVAAVLSGHSEMFERSFVDENNDGIGVQYYDVGVAGDGMRGRAIDSITGLIGTQNPFSQWTADGDAGEMWLDNGDGTFSLVDGGKHYGHLEVNIEALDDPNLMAKIILTPVYSFPILDGDYNLVGDTERRVYGDEVTLLVGNNGQIIPEPASAAMLLTAAGLLAVRRRR
jgi:hypothetical protein